MDQGTMTIVVLVIVVGMTEIGKGEGILITISNLMRGVGVEREEGADEGVTALVVVGGEAMGIMTLPHRAAQKQPPEGQDHQIIQ